MHFLRYQTATLSRHWFDFATTADKNLARHGSDAVLGDVRGGGLRLHTMNGDRLVSLNGEPCDAAGLVLQRNHGIADLDALTYAKFEF